MAGVVLPLSLPFTAEDVTLPSNVPVGSEPWRSRQESCGDCISPRCGGQVLQIDSEVRKDTASTLAAELSNFDHTEGVR